MSTKTTCSFAHPGTYGRECGSPATRVGVRKGASTKTGIFYALRCDACAKRVGGENVGLIFTEPFDVDRHINEW